MILMFLGAGIQRAHANEKPWSKVTVCLEGSARFGADLVAKSITFAGIGVVIDLNGAVRATIRIKPSSSV
jgi:hypothetical protein